MLRRRGHKIWLASALLGIWVSLWAWESWISQQRGETCYSDPETYQKYCATYNLVFVDLWHIGEFLNYYTAAIAAIATVLLLGSPPLFGVPPPNKRG